MMRFIFLRHGPTIWNEQRLLQGRSDISLSDSGRQLVSSWRLPVGLEFSGIYCSPLVRAVETAEILCRNLNNKNKDIIIDDRLVEMSFGIWEGLSLSNIRYRLRFIMARLEERGLDYCAAGGESPRVVGVRVLNFLKDIWDKFDGCGDILCVCHRGVIRSLYAQASGWDMCVGSDGLDMECLHIFGFDGEQVFIEKMNAYHLCSAQ